MSLKVRFSWFVLLVLSSFSLKASPAAEILDEGLLPPLVEEVVVSANLTPTGADTLGSAVTVLGPEEIEARDKTSVLELLRTIPGLEINQGGGPGRASAVFLRGAGSNNTLVLLDGTPLNSPNVGGYDFADLRTDQIERIEILRGPQSSLYGSEAIGGVINIVSRRARKDEPWQAEMAFGELESSRYNLSGGGAGTSGDFLVSASRERVEGLSAASQWRGNREKDPFETTSLTGLAGTKLGATGRLEAAVHWLDSEAAVDGFAWGIGPVDDPNWVQKRQTLSGSVKAEGQLSALWRQSARISLNRERVDGTDPDTVWNNFHLRTSIADTALQADFQLGRSNLLSLGTGYQERHGENIGNFDERVRLRSIFVQDQWSWQEKVFLTGAVRYDDHSVAGNEMTYRGTGAFRLTESWRLHASFGTGFRAPTFNELYFPYYGNTALKPETSRGADAGLTWTFAGKQATLDLTWFSNHFENLIAYDAVVFMAMNIDRARSRGMELTLGFRPVKQVQVEANYTYTDSEDLETGTLLPRRPKHRGGLLVLFHPGGRWSGTLSAIDVRKRIDSDGTWMDHYTRVDLGARYRLWEKVTAVLRVENLFNRKFEEIPGYTSPRRLATFGLHFTL